MPLRVHDLLTCLSRREVTNIEEDVDDHFDSVLADFWLMLHQSVRYSEILN